MRCGFKKHRDVFGLFAKVEKEKTKVHRKMCEESNAQNQKGEGD